MATLSYYISKRIDPNGRAEVLCRFNCKARTSWYAHTRIYAPYIYWDSAKGGLNLPNKTISNLASIVDSQNKLNALQSAIFTSWEVEQYTAQDGWLQTTIDAYHNISRQDRLRMPELVAQYAAHQQTSKRMQDQYAVIGKMMAEYEQAYHPLYTDAFTPEVVARLMEFYRNKPIVSKHTIRQAIRTDNTMASKERIIAAICAWAVRQGMMARSPFGRKEDGMYAPHTERYGDVIYLTEEERDRLAAYPFAEPVLQRMRDIFIFQCHIGCRVSDLLTLTQDNIEGEFLQYIPIKTRSTNVRPVRVPIDAVARSIIDRYKGGSRLLPFVSEPAYNEYIHIIARQAGLDRLVMVLKDGKQTTMQLWQVCTSHIARKTFSQSIFSHTRSEVVAASFTGHSPDGRALRRYNKVTDDMKKDIISEIMHGKDTEN